MLAKLAAVITATAVFGSLAITSVPGVGNATGPAFVVHEPVSAGCPLNACVDTLTSLMENGIGPADELLDEIVMRVAGGGYVISKLPHPAVGIVGPTSAVPFARFENAADQTFTPMQKLGRGRLRWESTSGTWAHDVVITDAAVGFEEQLNSADAPEVFSYVVRLATGYRLGEDPAGGLYVYDANGGVAAWMSPPAGRDARDVPVQARLVLTSPSTFSINLYHRFAPYAYPVRLDPKYLLHDGNRKSDYVWNQYTHYIDLIDCADGCTLVGRLLFDQHHVLQGTTSHFAEWTVRTRWEFGPAFDVQYSWICRKNISHKPDPECYGYRGNNSADVYDSEYMFGVDYGTKAHTFGKYFGDGEDQISYGQIEVMPHWSGYGDLAPPPGDMQYYRTWDICRNSVPDTRFCRTSGDGT